MHWPGFVAAWAAVAAVAAVAAACRVGCAGCGGFGVSRLLRKLGSVPHLLSPTKMSRQQHAQKRQTNERAAGSEQTPL